MLSYFAQFFSYFNQKTVMESVFRYLLQVPICIVFLSLDIYLLENGYTFAFLLGIPPVLLCIFLTLFYPIQHVIKPFVWHMSKNKIQSNVEQIISKDNDGSESVDIHIHRMLIHRMLIKYLLYKRPYLILYIIGTGIYVRFIIYVINAVSNQY